MSDKPLSAVNAKDIENVLRDCEPMDDVAFKEGKRIPNHG